VALLLDANEFRDQPLAAMLTRGLQALFTRWPRLALAVEPSTIRWRRRPGLRSIERLPVIAGA